MASTGATAFSMFRNKSEQRQKQKKENVVSFIKSENEKKQKRRDDRQKAAEEAKEGKKKRRRKRKTREEKEVQRDEQLIRSVDKSISIQQANKGQKSKNAGSPKDNKESPKANQKLMQKEDVKKLTKVGVPFMTHAKKKFEEKSGGKRKSDKEEEGEDMETHQSRAKSQMELIFGKSAEKLKTGAYQHSRVMINSDKMDSIVQASKSRKSLKKQKRKAEPEEDREEEESVSQPRQKQPKKQHATEMISPKSILKKSPSASSSSSRGDAKDDSDQPSSAPEKLSSIPGWRKLDADADTEDEGMKAFEWLISPVEPRKFFSKLWEKKPLLVKRKCPEFNAGWFSTSELDLILRKNSLLFGENIDVVTYSKSGKRETHNPEGRAFASVVWDRYQQGCSVRLLNPQSYSSRCWKMLSTLQEFFGCFVGANVYLTPPGSQGFAPHYDDIEAFVLQLEGRKRWRLYEPRAPNEVLPRFSSKNFEQSDLGECILDTVLEPGDVLYFPRGIIHQAVTEEETHSLHITVSTYQKTSWADLFEKMIPQTLAAVIEDGEEFRRGLPIGYLNHLGIGNQDIVSDQRASFLKTVSSLFDKMKESALVDGSVDQMSKDFLHDSLPPFVNEELQRRCCRGAGEHWRADEDRVGGVVELEPETAVKLLTKKSLRILMENETVWVFYATENLRTWHKRDPMCFQIQADQAENVEALIHAYPGFVKIDGLPAGTQEEKLTTMNALYDRGLIVTKDTLDKNWMYSDDDMSEDEEELGRVVVVGDEGCVDSDSEEEEDDDAEAPVPVKIQFEDAEDDYDKE